MVFEVKRLEAADNEILQLEQEKQELLMADYETIEAKNERGLIMNYVFVKDADGFVSKKLESEILSDEKIITQKEYLKKSGLEFYEKKINHGGARQGAGRKQKFMQPLKFQIRVTQEEKDFIQYARTHGFDFSNIIPSGN